MWWYPLLILGIIKLFIKSRDLFPLIAGFLFSRDTEIRLIHDEHIRCKRMTPKTIYYYFVFIPHFVLKICSRKSIFKGHVIETVHILN